MAGTCRRLFVAAVPVVWSLLVTPIPFVGVFSRVDWSSLPIMMLFVLFGAVSKRQATLDQTGLQGRWDFVLAFTALTANASPAVEPRQTDLPTVFVAVEEQLGLTLERNARGSVEYVIIASAHAPAEQ